MSVSTAAMTAATQTKTKSGTFTVGKKTYSYGGDLRASYTQATASASSGFNMNLIVRVEVTAEYGTETLTNHASDAILSKSASVTVNNTFTTSLGYQVGPNISKAVGTYGIGAIDYFNLEIN